MTRIRTYSRPAPMSQQSLDPESNVDRERRKRWATVLRQAEAGDKEALAMLRARGLVRWEREGRKII